MDAQLDELLPMAPAIALDGPKGVGKTATAQRRASEIRLLDNADQRRLVEADPTLTSLAPGTVLIDEWQWVPEVWDAVRRHVDDGVSRPPDAVVATGPCSWLEPEWQPVHTAPAGSEAPAR